MNNLVDLRTSYDLLLLSSMYVYCDTKRERQLYIWSNLTP